MTNTVVYDKIYVRNFKHEWKIKMLHDGHRERLRKKAIDYGFNCLEPHECLELLLGYAIPRKNTNDIAHALINRAGSLRAVFDMEMSELKQVEGMGVFSAFMVKLIGYIMNSPRNTAKKRAELNKFSLVKKYTETLFATSEREELYALYLDKKMTLTERVKISDGGAWQAGVSPRDILAPALLNGASFFILAHNHPRGTVKPSQDDLNFTVRMEAASNSVGITMIEHIVYAEGEVHPIMRGAKISAVAAIEYDEV